MEGVTGGENDGVNTVVEAASDDAENVGINITVEDSCRVIVGIIDVKSVSVGIISSDVVSIGTLVDNDSVAVISGVDSVVVSVGNMNKEEVSVKTGETDGGKRVSSEVGIDSVTRVPVNTTVSSREVVGTINVGSDVDGDEVNTVDRVEDVGKVSVIIGNEGVKVSCTVVEDGTNITEVFCSTDGVITSENDEVKGSIRVVEGMTGVLC